MDSVGPTRGPAWNIGITTAISVILAMLAGIAVVVYPWDSFQRLHLEELIPLFAEMSIVRSAGASSATLIVCLYVTALFHSDDRGGRPRDAEHHALERRGTKKTALLAAAAVPVLYLPVTALAMCGAMLTAYLGLGLAPSAFLDRVSADDVGRGAFTALLMGVIPAVWSLVGRKLFTTRKRGLGFKLFATWLLLAGFSIILRIGAAILAPEEPIAPLQIESSPTVE